MKKLFLLNFLLFQLAFVFGQSSNWGSWNQPDCFKGIQFRCRVKDYNSSAKQYTWEYEIKNSYNKKVAINYDIANTSLDGRTTIAAGGVDKSWCLNASNTQLYFTFSKLCFHFPNGFDQCSEYNQKGYASFADCDNGLPKYQVYNGINPGSSNNTSSTNTNNSSSNTNNQNYDPTFDRNNASFQDYYKRATSAGQAGNYDEAISLWNSAISVAVNDDQRNNARAWLAEVQKAKNNSNNNPNRQQTTYTPPQPTKLQKQAEALGQLNELFDNLTNQKQKEIDRQKRLREYERQDREKKLEKVRIQELENLERIKKENEIKAPISNLELINLINNNQKKEITNYFINQGFVFKYDDVDEIMFEGFSLNYSFLNFNKKKILVSVNTEISSEIIHILQKLSSLKEHISFFSKDSDKLLKSFYITIEKDNKTLSNGKEDDYSVLLKTAKDLNSNSNTQTGNVQKREITSPVESTNSPKNNSNKTIYTHTNGAQYYINKNGNKVFITKEEADKIKNESQSTNNNYTIGKELTKNLGKMSNGKDYLHIFDLPKNIISVKPSCGCLSAKISDNKKVLATFHGIVNYKGPVRKSILVTFEDGTTETLYISGELL